MEWGGWLAHKILVTAQRPIPLSLFGFGAGTLDWDLASGLSIYLKSPIFVTKRSFKGIIKYNGKECKCEQKDRKLSKKRELLASKKNEGGKLKEVEDEDFEEDVIIPEYEYDEDTDNVSEEEYGIENDVMEEEVIEREKGPDLR